MVKYSLYTLFCTDPSGACTPTTSLILKNLGPSIFNFVVFDSLKSSSMSAPVFPNSYPSSSSMPTYALYPVASRGVSLVYVTVTVNSSF